MKDIIFTLKITLDRFIVNDTDLGALTLRSKTNDSEYILDVTKSYTYDDDDCEGATEIQCELEVDRDTFNECKFDLTVEDLLSGDVYGSFYIVGNDEEFDVRKAILMFHIDGEHKSIYIVKE